MEMNIVLASASPRRKELLNQIGLEFDIVVSEAEEVITSNEPELVVQQLAKQKATEVFERVSKEQGQKNYLVIGADTVVAFEGKILGKPKTEEEAKKMLAMLQGNTHQVYTGCCLIKEGQEKVFFERTSVTFYPMTRDEIDTYVQTKDPMDKAGAYGIQGFCARYIKGIEGDYNNVVGLPVGRLYQEMRSL